MTKQDAWNILAEQSERLSVHSEQPGEDRLAALTALAVLADHIGLNEHAAAARAWLRSLRECDARQLRFRDLRRSEGGGTNGLA